MDIVQIINQSINQSVWIFKWLEWQSSLKKLLNVQECFFNVQEIAGNDFCEEVGFQRAAECRQRLSTDLT